VDILSGCVSIEQEDFTLPGRIPIQWHRSYKSSNHRNGCCGWGWETPADIRLEVDPSDGHVVLMRPERSPVLFPMFPKSPGDENAVLEYWDGALLSDHGSEYRVRTKEDQVYHFEKSLTRINEKT